MGDQLFDVHVIGAGATGRACASRRQGLLTHSTFRYPANIAISHKLVDIDA